MAIITKIETQKKNLNKANLFLDGKFFIGLYLDTCIKFGLIEGKEITESELEEIVIDSEKNICFNLASKYLNNAMKTVKQVKDYLYKKEYSTPTINYVINKLKEYNYLNDEEYAKIYVKSNVNKYGAYKLKTNLMQKGIQKDIADTAIKEFDNADEFVYNLAVKYMKNKTLTYESVGKLTRFLGSRGYSFDEINTAINKLKMEKNDVSWD